MSRHGNRRSKIKRRTERSRRHNAEEKALAAAAKSAKTLYDAASGSGAIPPNLRHYLEKQ